MGRPQRPNPVSFFCSDIHQITPSSAWTGLLLTRTLYITRSALRSIDLETCYLLPPLAQHCCSFLFQFHNILLHQQWLSLPQMINKSSLLLRQQIQSDLSLHSGTQNFKKALSSLSITDPSTKYRQSTLRSVSFRQQQHDLFQ